MLNRIGIRTTSVVPSSRVWMPLIMQPSSALLCRKSATRLAQSRGSDPHLECVLLHVDPLDEELHDLRLFGGEQLVPDCGEFGGSPSPGAGDQPGVIAMLHSM